MRGVAITGVGVVSAIGCDRTSFAAAIATGADGRDASFDGFSSMAVEAARAALLDAGLATRNVALLLGTSAAGLAERARFEADRRDPSWLRESVMDEQLVRVVRGVGLEGPAMIVTTACTASAHAIAHACVLLENGVVDAALAGGADAISDALIAGFTALGAMSDGPCAPFSEPFGMSLGEGACFFVLERARDAEARGRKPLANIRGHGLSADAHHATAPDPSGAGLARAMQAALTRAGVDADAIGYVNAHGTGTEANDSAEMRAIRRVLGPHAERIPISATKSMIGHALGAAAALESLAAIEGMRGGFLPPTIRFARPRPEAPADPVPSPRSAAFDLAMKTSAAFGGANAALIFSRSPPAQSEEVTEALLERSPVYIVGTALVGAGEDPQALVPRLDLSTLDRPSALLTASVALALESAGIRVRRELADRAGIFAAIAHLPWDAAREFFESWYRRGRASATAFSRMVMNGPAGAASRLLSLRGPGSVFAGACGTTLVALMQASLHIAEGEADLIAVGSAEVDDPDLPLVRGRSHPDRGAAVCLVSRALLERAVLSPLARVRTVRLARELEDVTRDLRADRILVVRAQEDNADAALLVEACRSMNAGATTLIAASDGRLAATSVLLES